MAGSLDTAHTRMVMSNLAPPIIVSDSGDIYVFADARELERKLEAIDVREAGYRAYDSEGRRLNLGTRQKRRRIFGFIPTTLERAAIVGVDPNPVHVAELEALLRGFLSRIGIDPGNRDLRALVQAVVAVSLEARR